MRIVCANNYFYLRGGAERVFFDEMAILDRMGLRVFPYSQQWPENLGSPAPWFLPGDNYATLANASAWRKVCGAAHMVYSRAQRRVFREYLREVQPSLVHGHNIYGGLSGAIIDAARDLQIPFLLTLHDYKLICPSYLMLDRGVPCEACRGHRYWRCLAHRCHKDRLSASAVVAGEAYFNQIFGTYEYVSYFIAPSRFLMQKHMEGGIPADKIVHLPNAIDPTCCPAQIRPGHYVLYAGRLSQEKGVLTLLKALAQTGIPLKVAGTGPAEGTCRRFAREHDMPRTEFCGHCQGDRLSSLYHDAAFVAVPSEWYENAPLSILEAFAHGKPVLGSNLGGIPEMVKNGSTGYLFEAGNVQELRERAIQMWSSVRDTVAMGATARRHVETHFSLEQHGERLLTLYQRAVGKTPPLRLHGRSRNGPGGATEGRSSA
jgi:glycosyltransferase involved in cell wall biosynthesis